MSGASRRVGLLAVLVAMPARALPQATSTLGDTVVSVGRLTARELQAAPAVTLLGGLQGRLAGVRVLSPSGDPGSAPSIRLRGATNISAPQDPLIIVDGTIVRGSLADLASEDIERVEVARGPVASALYGSDGGAGVILIFTKRGAELRPGELSIAVRNEVGPSFVSRRLAVSGAHSFQVTAGQGGLVTFLRDAQGRRILEPDRIADNPYPQTFDQQGRVLERGLFYTNHLSVAGRNRATRVRASFQNAHSEGVVFGLRGFRRQNLRLNLDQRIGPRVELQLSSVYAHSDDSQAGREVTSPFFALRFLEPQVDLSAPNPNGTPYAARIPDNLANASNPLYNLANERRDAERNRLIGGGGLRWRALDWLTAEAGFHADRLRHEFTDLVPLGYLTSSGTATDGSLHRELLKDHSSNGDISLIATGQLLGIRNVSRVTYLRERRTTLFQQESFDRFIARLPPEPPVVDSSTHGLTITNLKSRNWSVLGTSLFALRNRYFLELLLRRDEPHLLAPGARSHWYHRVAAAWRVSENFKIPGLDELRLHAGYGTAGVRPDLLAVFQSGAALGPPFDPLKPERSSEVEAGAFAETMARRLELEYTYARKTTTDQISLVDIPTVSGFVQAFQNTGTLTAATHELTLRAALVDRGGLSWSAALTATRTRQQISEYSLPERLVAFGQQPSAWYIAQGQSFGVLFGNRFVRSIGELYDDPAKQQLSGSGQAYDPANFVLNEEGYLVPAASWRCGEDLLNRATGAGCPTPERPIKYVTCRTTTAAGTCGATTDLVKIGDTNPDFIVGLHSSLRLKHVEAAILFDWVQGGSIYNGSRQWSFLVAQDRVFDQRAKPEAERKSVPYYQAFYNGLNPQQYFVESGTYLKVRELAVSYAFGPASLRTLGLRVGLIGRNLFTFSRFSGYDPEVAGLQGDPFLFRIDWFSYPHFRSVTGMIEASF